MGAPGLLARFQGNPLPASYPLDGRLSQPALSPDRFERLNRRDSQLGRLFHQPFEAIELYKSRDESDSNRGRRRIEFLNDAKRDRGFARDLDFGKVHVAIIRELVNLARLRAKHADQVLGIRTCQFRRAAADFRNEKAATSHAGTLL